MWADIHRPFLVYGNFPPDLNVPPILLYSFYISCL